MNKGFRQSKNGMALALVLVVMAVVAILGLVVLQTTVAETRFAARDEHRMKAYYMARSGVEATVSWMLNPSNNGAAVVDKTSGPATLPGVTNGSFTVAVTTKSSTQLLVTGTGTVNGVTAKAAMTLDKVGVGGGDPVFDCTVYAGDRLEVGGHTSIEGEIGVGDYASIVYNGGRAAEAAFRASLEYPGIVAPPPVFPADPDTAADLTDNGTGTLIWNLTADPHQTRVYKKLALSNKTLVIKTGPEGNIVNLVVDELIVDRCTIRIEGEGRLDLFVKTEAKLDSYTNYNDPAPSYPNQLIIYLADGSSATLNANRIINAFVYGPGAKVTINGTNGFTGAVLASDVTCSGTSDISDGRDIVNPISYDELSVFLYEKGEWVTP